MVIPLIVDLQITQFVVNFERESNGDKGYPDYVMVYPENSECKRGDCSNLKWSPNGLKWPLPTARGDSRKHGVNLKHQQGGWQSTKTMGQTLAQGLNSIKTRVSCELSERSDCSLKDGRCGRLHVKWRRGAVLGIVGVFEVWPGEKQCPEGLQLERASSYKEDHTPSGSV